MCPINLLPQLVTWEREQCVYRISADYYPANGNWCIVSLATVNLGLPDPSITFPHTHPCDDNMYPQTLKE